jgi:hypothetical protein
VHRREALWILSWLGATLLAKAKPSDRRTVTFDVLTGQIGQQTAPLSHELEKSSPRVEVVLVSAEVIGEPVDSLGEESNLNFRRTGIIRVRAKLSNDRFFLFALQRHPCRSLSEKTPLQIWKNRAHLSTQPVEYSIRGTT